MKLTVAASPGVDHDAIVALAGRLSRAELDIELQENVPHAKKADGPFPPEVWFAIGLAIAGPSLKMIGEPVAFALRHVVSTIADRAGMTGVRYSVSIGTDDRPARLIYTVPTDDDGENKAALDALVDHALATLDGHVDRRWNSDLQRWQTLDEAML